MWHFKINQFHFSFYLPYVQKCLQVQIQNKYNALGRKKMFQQEYVCVYYPCVYHLTLSCGDSQEAAVRPAETGHNHMSLAPTIAC